MADETNTLPEAHRLQKLREWEKDHGYKYPDHARDVRTLLRIIDHMQTERASLIIAASHLSGMTNRVEKATTACDTMIGRVECIMTVIKDDIDMFGRIADRLLSREPVTLDQLSPDEQEWVEHIPQRVSGE